MVIVATVFVVSKRFRKEFSGKFKKETLILYEYHLHYHQNILILVYSVCSHLSKYEALRSRYVKNFGWIQGSAPDSKPAGLYDVVL